MVNYQISTGYCGFCHCIASDSNMVNLVLWFISFLSPSIYSRTAVDWMIRANFREGNEMSYSHDENDEFRYQQKGYARYADIAKLFGWEVLHKFWRQEHLDDAAGEKGAGDELNKVDSRTLRLSIAAGVDLTPLIRE